VAERLHPITIELNSADIVITRDAREAILNRVVDHELGNEMRRAFEDVSPTGPVLLTAELKTNLLTVLDDWSTTVNTENGIPDGLAALRDALIEDLRDAERD